MCRRLPTWAASRQSRAMIASSATAGQPLQPEPAGELALVHLGVLGEPRLLRVLGDDPVERLDVLQRPAHQHRVGDALAVVGEDPHPGGRVGHRTELGELLAGQADGDGTDREDVAVTGLAAEPPDLLHDAGGVGDRVGVGHRVHGGEPAERRGLGAGVDGLGVLAPRLTQVGVQVDQPGQQDRAAAVDDLGALGRRAPAPISAITPSRTRTSTCSPPYGRTFVDQVAAHEAAPSWVETAGSLPPSRR